ncbi:Acyltransferase 3 [Pleurostoma richardsiae]|uniref:Acyltransferase 3 n=1 Tax=Pleurostoma richardsiae TaxID=41990 RepID=A0AA38RV03_9PEZI|nr:Acyltransferase 3 [Pleurostoma richardsiae]
MHAQREGGLLDGIAESGSGLPWKRGLRWLKTSLWPQSAPVSDQPLKLRPTAYLDGLRGFAAFIVYWHHHELWTHAAEAGGDNAVFENAFGWNGNFHFATFYGVRNFFSGGHIAVALFYVISGYVLTLKPLSLIHAGELLKLGDNLASAFFRRWFRLYIPLIVTTFVTITIWHAFGIWNAACEPKSTYREEVWEWYADFKNFSFLFKEGGKPWLDVNQHLWSIPLEMRGSMVVYIAALALSRATTNARLLCLVLLAFYFMYIADGYYGALFVAGMLQSDLDQLAKKYEDEFPRFLRRLEPYKTFIYYHLLVIAMFLSGVPTHDYDVEHLRQNPGWYWLSYLKPQAVFDYKWFYLFWAANFIVAAVPRIPWLKRFFECRFCQYLGRISFSLYLVHGPVLHMIGDRLYAAVGWARPVGPETDKLGSWINIMPLPKTGPMGLEVAFLLPHIILLPLTLWVADVVTRAVDEPSVKIAQWMYKKIQGGPPPPKPEDAMRLA